MHAALVSRLTDLLEQEAGTYDALLELAERKQAALLGGEALALEPIIEGEQALLWRLGRLRDARGQVTRELGAELGLPGTEPSLGDLAGAVPADDKAAFERAEAALAGVLERLARLNRTNAALIESALRYVDFSLQVLARARPEGAAYGSDGRPGLQKPGNGRRRRTQRRV